MEPLLAGSLEIVNESEFLRNEIAATGSARECGYGIQIIHNNGMNQRITEPTLNTDSEGRGTEALHGYGTIVAQ